MRTRNKFIQVPCTAEERSVIIAAAHKSGGKETPNVSEWMRELALEAARPILSR
jgi:uncharacterized protein (DUF1778 family)